MKEIIDTVKVLFTADQWQRVVEWFIGLAAILIDGLLSILLVAALVFVTAQMFKIVFRRSSGLPSPSDWQIHCVAFAASLLWSFSLLDGDYAQRGALALLAWFAVWLVVTFGGALLKYHNPKLWSALNMERRTRPHAAGPDGERRRSGDVPKEQL